MPDPCVHCGDPVIERDRLPDIHAHGGMACDDGSGHVACVAQGGLE